MGQKELTVNLIQVITYHGPHTGLGDRTQGRNSGDVFPRQYSKTALLLARTPAVLPGLPRISTICLMELIFVTQYSECVDNNVTANRHERIQKRCLVTKCHKVLYFAVVYIQGRVAFM